MSDPQHRNIHIADIAAITTLIERCRELEAVVKGSVLQAQAFNDDLVESATSAFLETGRGQRAEYDFHTAGQVMEAFSIIREQLHNVVKRVKRSAIEGGEG